MSLETGTISFRMFYLRDDASLCSTDALSNLQRAALPDLASVVGEKADGWCGPRHMMDRDLSLANIEHHEWLRLNYVRAIRKVPETLLVAECKAVEQAELKARGGDFLPRVYRAEIKQRVREALMAKAQPTLNGIGVWIDCAKRIVLAEATTDGKIDHLCPAFKAVFGNLPILATPETAAITLIKANVNDLDPVTYTPDPRKEPSTEVALGMEFLTWLMWRYEETGGDFRTRLHGPMTGYMLEGPLTFFHAGQGAHEVCIRKGNPINSREAMACLLEGKLLRKAKVVIVRGDNIWSVTVDDGFLFSALKLPPGERMDQAERFAERALFVTEFLDAWFCLFGLFMGERVAPTVWALRVRSIRDWIAKRNGMEVSNG